MPDETPPPPDDWAFPPVQPVDPPLLGWTPEPALPAAPVAATEVPVPAEAAASAYDVGYAPVEPTSYDAPSTVDTPAEPVAEPVAEAPPSAAVLPVPRRHPAAAAPVSPLRALAGAAVAVAGVLLGIGALLWATDGPKGTPALEQTQARSSLIASTPSPELSPSSSAVAPTPSPAPAAVSVATTPPAAPKLALTVLNNSNRTGLAKRAAARYAAAGWPIKLTGSFRGRVTATTVYYAPGQQASALALQKAFPAIERVRPRFAGLPGSGLTVVLIRTYPA